MTPGGVLDESSCSGNTTLFLGLMPLDPCSNSEAIHLSPIQQPPHVIEPALEFELDFLMKAEGEPMLEIEL